MKFTDAVMISTDGPLRLFCLKDGWYVAGEGILMAVDSEEEAQELIKELKEREGGEMTKRAIGYCRVSTDEQKEGLSLDNQEGRIKAYAVSQGWDLVGIYRDEGFSGKDLKRPALRQLIEDAKAKKFHAVAVYRIDRLSRRQRDFLYLMEDVFEAQQIIFKSVTEPLDTSSPIGRAMISMISTFAQLEREVTVERITDALGYKKSKGEWIGRPPYGFKILKRTDAEGNIIKDKTLTINPEQAEVVKRIFQARSRGKTLAAITEGIIAKGINSRAWSPALINGILHNPVYLKVVSKRIFEKVQ